MKQIKCFLIVLFVLFQAVHGWCVPMQPDDVNGLTFTSVNPASVKIGGYPGAKIDLCIAGRIKAQDVEHLIEPFRTKNESRLWQSEFWGKWMLSAVAAWKYTHDPALMTMMDGAVTGLLETQLPNGYIGNYSAQNQLQAWDIWGRKYSMLGLIRYYEITNNSKALQAAQRVADHLLAQIGPGKTNIINTGNYRGMASSSVLEPVVYLYHHTREERYLNFAHYIVAQWETEEGPKLISKALEGVPVSERFTDFDVWWGWENGQKAYEMMSCYEGLLQLYLVDGKDEYLDAVIGVVDHIIDAEINLAGSGSAFECWYRGIENQTRPTYHTMETCVTITWMKLCHKLLQVTGDSRYADQIETSFYNALLASMKFDAGEIAKYSPLEGRRHAGEEQCGMHINCCNANGPRGFTLMPEYVYMQSAKGIVVNYYGESEAELQTPNGGKVHLMQQSDYPVSGQVKLVLQPEKADEFEVLLRIPAWSRQTSVTINGEQEAEVQAGKYLKLKRKWQPGDVVELRLGMAGRLLQQDHFQAIVRGPVVLARDSRFADGFVDETAVVQHENGVVELQAAAQKPDNVWMAFSAPLVLGTDLEGEFRQARQIRFCDFGSAGNTWDEHTRYRVWIPQTLNVMKKDYNTY